MRILFIPAARTHALRQAVLRPAQPLAEMDWPLDLAGDSFHLGMEHGGAIIAVATFIRQRHELLRGWKPYRLRGMATHPAHRMQGAGMGLLRFGLDHLRGLRADLAWCNARDGAKDFYARAGFVAQGEPFLIEGIGIHHLMYKAL